MKNKMVKKLIVLGLACSMALSGAPASALAAETGTEAHTESETKQSETLRNDDKKKETETEKETEVQELGISEDTEALPGESEAAEQSAEELMILDLTSREDTSLKITGGTSGTDYTYDENTGVLVIKSDAKLKVTGTSGKDYNGQILVEAKGANLTIESLSLESESGSVLVVKEGCSLNLTLSKTCKFEPETRETEAISIEKNADLTIDGNGILELSVSGNARSVAMSKGDKKTDEDEEKDTPSSLEIKDGTVYAQAGISVSGDESQKVTVKISGGSVNLKKMSTSDKKEISLTGADGKTSVYKAEITVNTEDSQVEDLAVTSGGTSYEYGNSGIYKDDDQKIYLYLPAKAASVDVAGSTYEGEVKTSDDTVLSKAKADLSAEAVTIPSVSYGYEETGTGTVLLKNASNATTVKAEITGENKDAFELVSSQNTEVSVPGKTSSGSGENSDIKVEPKADLDAGTYTAKIKITDTQSNSSILVPVTFTVEKVKLTATAEIDEKVYDGKRAGSGTVTLSGAVRGETPEVDADKVTYTFNSANVKDATSVTVGGLELLKNSSVDWSKNYELAETKIHVAVTDKIKKAPNIHTKDELKTPVVTTVYNSTKGIWQAQMTTYKGQEYLFFGSLQSSLTDKNKSSSNWVYGSSEKTTENRKVDMKNGGLAKGTTYTVWTRFAGDDNHEASDGEVMTYTTFSVSESSTSASGNKINGITEGTTYKIGSRLAFGAVGAGMSNTSPKAGDERYLPVSWKVSEEHSWTSSPYEAAFTINQAGSYTLQVTFRKQTYANNAWKNTDATTVSTVNFKMAATGADGTGYTTSTSTGTSSTGTGTSSTSSTSTGTSSTSSTSKTNTAAKTGDQSPILPLVIVCIVAAGVIVYMVLQKKKKK